MKSQRVAATGWAGCVAAFRRRLGGMHRQLPGGDHIMLKWALFFAVLSLVAAVFGFTGIASGAAAIAQVLFFLFLVLCVFAIALVFLGVELFN
jgi:uncharacterized membrane protein YtjA (UPF0391 family)